MISKTKASRNIFMAVVWQAVKDYVKTTSEGKKTAILNQLRDDYITGKTDGFSAIVAEQLEKNPEEIAERMKVVLSEVEEEE